MSSQLAAAVLLYEQSTCIAGFDQTPEPCDYAKVKSPPLAEIYRIVIERRNVRLRKVVGHSAMSDVLAVCNQPYSSSRNNVCAGPKLSLDMFCRPDQFSGNSHVDDISCLLVSSALPP
jgi:hypothetical protein